MTRCDICHRPLAADDRYACRPCEHHLSYVLQQLPAEAVLLRDQLAPYRSPRLGSRFGGRGAHAPLPVDARVLDLLAVQWVPDPHGQDTGGIPIGPALVGWASMVAGEYPYAERRAGTAYVGRGCEPVPRQAGISGWAAWLRLYLPVAVTCHFIAQMHDDLDDVLRRVRAITGTQPRSRRRYAPCPACDTYGLQVTDGIYGVDCRVCGHHMSPDAYAVHAAEVLPALTLDALADASELTADAPSTQTYDGLEAAG